MSGSWIQTISGKVFYPMAPREEDVDISDIAWALSMQCRFAGHVKYFYSVAQHSVLLSRSLPPKHALWGLLHDASEAYLVDVPRPIKNELPAYKQAEDRLTACIAKVFELTMPIPELVKELDSRILFNEKEVLLNSSAIEWQWHLPSISGVVIRPWSQQEAFEQFLERFEEIGSNRPL